MSWAAHDLEPYAIQHHFGKRIAFVPLLAGSYAPDLLSKWFVYGISVAGIELKADNPAQFHRGWPGFGFTHSLTFGVVLGLLLYALTKRPVIAYSFVIGQWAHCLTDIGDTVGVMLFFPFTTHLYAVGAWAYAGQAGRQVDAGAYFSGLGFVWDGFWLVVVLISWRVLTRTYFREKVVQADPFWGWAGKSLSETFLFTVYVAAFFYGTCRWVAWLIWAHVVRAFPFDLSWGGPGWAPRTTNDELNEAASCGCPSCRAASGTMAMYGFVAVAAWVRHPRRRSLRKVFGDAPRPRRRRSRWRRRRHA